MRAKLLGLLAGVMSILLTIAYLLSGSRQRAVQKANERLQNANAHDALTQRDRERAQNQIDLVDSRLMKETKSLPEDQLWERLRAQGRLKD